MAPWLRSLSALDLQTADSGGGGKQRSLAAEAEAEARCKDQGS